MHKIITVIPARGGSLGVVNKNIRNLCGQPLIAYSILDSLRCKNIEATYVSTDSIEIADISLQFGAEVPFLRPKEYAQKDSLDIEWAKHFLGWYYERYSTYPEYIVHLRATTPFRDIKIIEDAITLIKKYPEATSLTSVEEASEVYKTFKVSKNGLWLESLFDIKYHLMPRQSLDLTYRPNGYVDILKTERLLKGEFHGDKILAYIVNKVPEIDTETDLEYASYWGEKYLGL
jgi:CMP-N-acetylneuraminic acid synthetase